MNLLINGTILLALGLTSITYNLSSFIAYWMFIKPTILRFIEICSVVFLFFQLRLLKEFVVEESRLNRE